MWQLGIASAPILTVLLMLFVWRQSSLRAGLSAWLTAVLIALATPLFRAEPDTVIHASARGVLTASIIAYVLFFGLLLYHLMSGAGLIRSLSAFISRSTRDPVRQILLLVVAFSPLVESVSGFGLAITIIAPILVQLGFGRFKAALLALVSMSAVPWGALGTGTVIGSNLAGVSLHQMGSGAAILSIPAFFLFAVAAVYIAGGWRGIRKRWMELFFLLIFFILSLYLFSAFVSVELAGVFASMIAIGAELACIRLFPDTATPGKAEDSSAPPLPDRGVVKAMSPYLFLTGLLLVSRLVPPVQDLLNSHLVIDAPGYRFALPLLYSPGFFLFLTCLYTSVLFKIPKKKVMTALQSTWKQWTPVVLSMAGLIAMSEVMSASGMTEVLALAASRAFGAWYVWIAPLIGALGGFLTGSNAAANAMLIQLQAEVADQLGMATEEIAVLQNAAAAHMTMASPSRVLLAASVCQIPSEENRLLKAVAPIAVAAVFSLTIL
ncbi:MAG: L-lactate permease [Planifilum fimeticola]